MKRTAVAVMGVILISLKTAGAEPVRLSLAEAITTAIQKNLDLKVELYSPAQLQADINRSRAIYDPVLGVQASYADSTTSSSSPAASTFTNEVQTLILNSSLSSLFWTGATASLTFNNSYVTTNSASSRPRYWQSGIGAAVSQPLLKKAGKEQTEVAINVARLSKFSAMERYKGRMQSLVAQVRVEYFKLYSLREDLEVKKVSLGLARKILDDTKARVKAGVLPAMETLNAEYGVASREKELIDAELAVHNQIDTVRLLLQMEAKGDILTVDLPERAELAISADESLKKAASRPEIREQKRNLEIAELQTRVFHGKSRPDLSLNASAGLGGLDRTFPRTIDNMATFDTPYWSIGLNFSYPLGNGAAENDYRKSRLKSEQTALQLRSLEESISNEVAAAIRGVNASYKQIEVADRGRSFAEERLRAFIRKNEVGLATTKDVLDVENDLAVAKSNQIKAAVAYANALTKYWQSTGELLEREKVRFVEGDADHLYSAIR